VTRIHRVAGSPVDSPPHLTSGWIVSAQPTNGGLMFKLFHASTIALGCLLAASVSQAQTLNRAWVSGHGTDTASCGAPTTPCRSLQYAHDHVVAAGGEIDVLDPAGYGALAITKAISIINDGVGTAGVQATSGAAIAVSAGPSDAVLLRGLDIEGVGAATGVHLTGGASLTLQDSTIKGFTSSGLLFEPAANSYLVVSNSRVTNNGSFGVRVRPFIASGTAVVQVTLERAELISDTFGFDIDGTQSGPNVTIDAVVADSLITNNSLVGIENITQDKGVKATTFVMVRNCTVAYSASAEGADVEGAAAVVQFAHSTLTGLDTAFGTFNGGTIQSYGDNDVGGVASLGTTPTVVPQQ